MTFKHSFATVSITLISTLLLAATPAGPARPPASVPASAPARGSLRYSVVVDKFENKSKNDGDLGGECETLLTSKLHESGHFIVVAQTDMQVAAVKEQLRDGIAGVQGRKTAVRSQMTPAQLLVKGVITYVKEGASDQGGGWGIGKFKLNAGRRTTEVRATLQMIDASTGALVAAKELVGLTQSRAFSVEENNGANIKMGKDDNLHAAFEKAITDVIPWMVAQLPSVRWRGTVVKVDKDRITINRGSREGVSAGDEFIVGESEILRDPDTGEVLDEVLHERARIKVVSVSERTSVCNVVSGAADQVIVRMAIQYSSES